MLDNVTTYDELPYDHRAFAASHPDRIATVASLAGLEPPSLERCRVLELGCGSGGNLIPMAVGLPEAEFIGVDLSERQIADGRALVEQLGLGNVRIERGDIARLDRALGEFDYIVCHGVYSWVPEPVQDRILALCHELLSPAGLAYISYNVLPGWNLRAGLRELLLLHTERGVGARARVGSARDLIARLVESLPELDGTYAQVLAAVCKTMDDVTDPYLFHEYLEAENRPVYFREFVDRASRHGLHYTGEATLAAQEGRSVSRAFQLADALDGDSADRIRREQYADLLRGCGFRRSLLCRVEAATAVRSREDAVVRLRVASRMRRVSDAAPLDSDAPETFCTADGLEASTNHPLLKTAFVAIGEAWPSTLTFDELWVDLRGRLAGGAIDRWIDDARDRSYVAGALAQAGASGLVELHAFEPRLCAKPGERPLASPYARVQAANGEKRVVNLRHHTVELGVFDQLLLPLLDGGHDRAAIADELAARVRAGDIEIERDARSLRDDPAALAAALPPAVEGGIARSAATALLMA